MRLFVYQIVQQDSKCYWFDLSKHPSMEAVKELNQDQLIDMCQKSLELIYKKHNNELRLKRKPIREFKVKSAEIVKNELKVIIE